jgi:hypothetical protein
MLTSPMAIVGSITIIRHSPTVDMLTGHSGLTAIAGTTVDMLEHHLDHAVVTLGCILVILMEECRY